MSHNLPEFSDKASDGGVNKILTVAAGAIEELIVVGTEVQFEREYVSFEALDTGMKWGYSGDPGGQIFNCYKSQFFILPFGPGTRIFFLNTKGTPVDIAIAEVS